MKVSRNASPLMQALIEAGAYSFSNPPHSQSIDRPRDKEKGHSAKDAERIRLIPGARNTEVQACALIVPHAVVIASDHAKTVLSGA